MEIIGKAVHQEPDGSLTVEFVDKGGDVVAVHIAKSDDDTLNRNTAEDRAKVMMVQVVNFGPDEVMAAPELDGTSAETATVSPDVGLDESPAAISLRKARAVQNARTPESNLEEGLESSFPASDPVSATTSTIPGVGPAASST